MPTGLFIKKRQGNRIETERLPILRNKHVKWKMNFDIFETCAEAD